MNSPSMDVPEQELVDDVEQDGFNREQPEQVVSHRWSRHAIKDCLADWSWKEWVGEAGRAKWACESFLAG